MALKKAFIQRINGIATDAPNYRIDLEFFLVDELVSQNYNLQFSAPWGADWRLQARKAIEDWVLEHVGDTVDGVVMPDLSSI